MKEFVSSQRTSVVALVAAMSVESAQPMLAVSSLERVAKSIDEAPLGPKGGRTQ